MAKSGKKKSKGAVSVNFKGTDSSGRSIKDGWAVGKVVEAELTEAKESGNEMFKIVIEAKHGKQKAKVWDNLVLTPNALWKMRSLLEAAGVEVDEEDDMEFTAEDLLDLDEFDVEIVNEEFENKMRPKVASFAPLGTHTDEDSDDEDEDSDDDEDDEDEKPSKKSKKKSSKSDDDDEDEEEDDDDEEEDEEEDEKPSKSKSKRRAKDDEDDEDEDEDDEDDEEDDDSDDDEDDEDDEDEDDEPKKKKGKSKSKLRAGQQVKFEDDKGRTKKGVITSVDGDTVFVEDAKGEEWEISIDEIL